MSELISGKEAKLAWANGKTIEFHYAETIWAELSSRAQLSIFDDEEIKFRLKPRTITINGIEVPAPDHIEKNPNLYGGWAINIGSEYYMYKSESNYNIVVAALRSIFNPK